MRIGLHIRVAKGLTKAIEEAHEIGAECIQMFATNPTAWKPTPLHEEKASAIRELLATYDIRLSSIHTPYLLNLGSSNRFFYERTEMQLRFNVEAAAACGAAYVVTHIGSHKGEGFPAALARITPMLDRVLTDAPNGPMLLLEGSSGAGDLIGNTFEELAAILDTVPDHRDKLGVCLDSAHLHAAGYDLSTKIGARRVFARFDELVGMDRLHLIHANDTQQALGSHKDRHWHIGDGNIGERGFSGMMAIPHLTRLDWVMETPGKESAIDKKNLDTLKRLRAKAGIR